VTKAFQLSSGEEGQDDPGDVLAQSLSHAWTMCYENGMFPDRQMIAARIVLDDRSRLPWRFFGRLTTAAITA
jgi:hypothetical protein